MSDEKRTTLSLKRKRTGHEGVATEGHPAVVPGRKKVVTVSSPPAWKVKKERLAGKAQQAVKPEAAPVEVPVAEPKPAKKPHREHKGVKLMPLAEAVALMRTYWPGLFEGEIPRPLAIGTRERLIVDIDQRALPVSRKRIKHCLKSLTRAECYLSLIQAGASRYDLQGNFASTVTPEEERYAKTRMLTERLRIERRLKREAGRADAAQ